MLGANYLAGFYLAEGYAGGASGGGSNRAVADSITIADAIVGGIARPIADTITISDSIPAATRFYGGFGESVFGGSYFGQPSSTTSPAVVTAHPRPVADTIRIGDLATTGGGGGTHVSRTAADTITISEIVSSPGRGVIVRNTTMSSPQYGSTTVTSPQYGPTVAVVSDIATIG